MKENVPDVGGIWARSGADNPQYNVLIVKVESRRVHYQFPKGQVFSNDIKTFCILYHRLTPLEQALL